MKSFKKKASIAQTDLLVPFKISEVHPKAEIFRGGSYCWTYNLVGFSSCTLLTFCCHGHKNTKVQQSRKPGLLFWTSGSKSTRPVSRWRWLWECWQNTAFHVHIIKSWSWWAKRTSIHSTNHNNGTVVALSGVSLICSAELLKIILIGIANMEHEIKE